LRAPGAAPAFIAQPTKSSRRRKSESPERSRPSDRWRPSIGPRLPRPEPAPGLGCWKAWPGGCFAG
jgi:hypothetical protein